MINENIICITELIKTLEQDKNEMKDYTDVKLVLRRELSEWKELKDLLEDLEPFIEPRAYKKLLGE